MSKDNTKQRLNFAELYHNCREAVESALTSMWIGETLNESQKDYARQLEKIIGGIFAPADAVPLIECLNPYESVPMEDAPAAEALIGDLWRKTLPKDKYYTPYIHQRRSWEILKNGFTEDGRKKSIVVTTGTGSGKTECFMLPLVNEILTSGERGKVQAIFLYPLNALMDDQKERLEKLVFGTGLRYAVYNGNLAERDDPNNDAMQRKIKLAKGTTINDRTGEEYDRFPSCVATREELRDNPPEILLTNPTMLEYVLLRDKDNNLLQEEALKWIVIDETHTYTGAGAAELSMLLRRVMLAYGLSPRQVRFATSSATIGNNQDPKEREKTMRKFISGIAGIDEDQVEVIDGKRIDLGNVKEGLYADSWNRLFESVRNGNSYMSLGHLLPGGDSIEEKLNRLEAMCEEAPKGARVKVHYFFRVPNGGLFVRLSDKEEGSFKIYTSQGDFDNTSGIAPLMELSRCKKCGEFVAIGRGDTTQKTYGPVPMDDSDMFDLEPDDKSNEKNLIFALTRGDIYPGDGNQGIKINGDKYQTVPGLLDNCQGWEVVMNTHNCCPFCGEKLTKKTEEDDDDSPEDADSKKLQKFRVPVDLVSRWMAPQLLDQLSHLGKEDSLHHGQQYISFVDSRQGAAKASLRQNLDIERQWLYSRIYHHLSELALDADKGREEISAVKEAMGQALTSGDTDRLLQLSEKLKTLQNKAKGNLNWTEVAEFLSDDPMSDVLVKQFAKRTSDSEEFDEDGAVKHETKRKYIHSIMVEYLGKRPAHAAAPETMGLFTTCYPQLEEIRKREVPQAVKDFNESIDSETLKISSTDWADLMQVFLDYSVRINESIFLRLGDRDPLDIFTCVRFETQKNRRRPAKKSQVSKSSRSRIVRYLAQLLVDDGQGANTDEILSFASDQIQEVIEAFWTDLISIGLLQISTRFEDGRHVEDADMEIRGKIYRPYRLNVADISFKLYERVALADTMSVSGPRVVKRLRPVETVFKKFSPYLRNRIHPVPLSTEYENWSPFNLGRNTSKENVHEWAKTNRRLLWDHQLWNEYGPFATRLNEVHMFPELFIQAEHTAQVDKIIARQVQEDFKRHRLNILACSTTMEMGVDLGSLELVMMCSVPPMPSNYKQRAGRSGRNDMVKSAAVTLCGSDSIGLRTLYAPMDNVIERPVNAPSVDLQSPQVIQRHVNAFLIRESGVFRKGDSGGKISQRVFHFYTDFKYEEVGQGKGRTTRLTLSDGREVMPKDSLGDESKTLYAEFNTFCQQPLSNAQERRLRTLVEGTVFDGQLKSIVERALIASRQSRSELLKKIDFIKHLDWDKLSDAQKTFFRMKYYEPLMTQLIGFWGDTRFTPNANMPVNVVTYDVNSSRLSHYTQSTSNPSYDLRNALAQYVPGNSVALDGRVSVVRGVRYHDFLAKTISTFKTIYRNEQRTVIDTKEEISKPIPWTVNGQEGLRMIQPTEFLPDTTETENRIIANPVFTRVNAQLIGASKWTSSAKEPHLFSARSSRQSANSEILYYNDGIGFGYCHCIECGKIVMESAVADWRANNLEDLPSAMNNREPKENGNTMFHYKVGERDKKGKPIYCRGSRTPHLMQRNVVLADTFVTDYTEIRIRYATDQKWVANRRDANGRLLTTLAIVFSQTLAEFLGKERDAFGFAVTPNGHICIFDCNPGGAGYSNQLANIEVMNAVISMSYQTVQEAIQKKSKDMILDKFTMQFLRDIDLKLALDWLSSEIGHRNSIPEEISVVSNSNVSEASLQRLNEAIENARGGITLFFNDGFDSWNYGNTEEGWLGYHKTRFLKAGAPIKICLIRSVDDNSQLPRPAINMLRKFDAAGYSLNQIESPFENEVYPLAIIDGKMFLTNNPENANLDQFWASSSMYVTQAPSFSIRKLRLDEDSENTKIIKLAESDTENIKSNELGSILYDRAKVIIDRFSNLCQHSEDKLEIEYQDEHLKSTLGMTVALQVVDYFVNLFNRPFNLGFRVESYTDPKGTLSSITGNLPNSYKRDEKLTHITERWLDGLTYPYGDLEEIHSQEKGSLTHWRVLTFRLGNTSLSIYPDGGFINGWKPGRDRFYTDADMDVTNPITLRRAEDIKFDITLEENE